MITMDSRGTNSLPKKRFNCVQFVTYYFLHIGDLAIVVSSIKQNLKKIYF
jgi:hypothetical protein